MAQVILHNRAKCLKCGEVLESKYRWDYVTCSCGALSVDGGHDYLKRSGNLEDIEELSESVEGPDTIPLPRGKELSPRELLFLADYFADEPKIVGGKLAG